MAEYYTIPEADAKFAPIEHTHNLEELGGTELPANRVAVPENVSADFGDAFTIDEALVSIAEQLDGKAPANHTHSGYAAASHTHAPAAIGAAAADHSHNYAAPTHSHPQSEITDLTYALSAKADLVDGKVPDYQLPSYVDDVIEGTLSNSITFRDALGVKLPNESDKIYVDTTTNKSYRWSGSMFVEINGGIALGETSATAFRGDHGKAAYDHSQNGGVHVTTEQKNAWNAKSDFSGSYADLTDKPTIPTTAAEVGAIAKALQMTADNGNVEYEMAGMDVLATIQSMPTGMHTGYCPVNSTNAPLSNEAWRFLVHKTGVTYGWVLAFGSYGSVYSNYINAGTWRGWKCLVDGTSAPLWKHESNGGYYMTATQTVTPSKALDKCRTGWLLVWSDHDSDTGNTNNSDICTCVIPKRGPTGALWSGQGFMCSLPGYMATETDTDITRVKKVYVHNTKLVGAAGNDVGNRRDIVLRAIYEY